MLIRALGNVTSILSYRSGTLEIAVDVDGQPGKAIAYTGLTGELQVGDEVLLNTTAVTKGLGTGGYHYVMANLTNPISEPDSVSGHIVKARYTPVQHTVLSVEEDDSPFRAKIEGFQSLDTMPVLVGQLHSQLAPAAGAIKRLSHGRLKIAYVMTDSAGLPLGFSRLVNELKHKGLLDATITAGQAFGGDYETVGVHTALITAKEVAGADVAIVCPGPGNVGTGTTYGFSSIEQGDVINAVNMLGGTPIAIARVSFADARPRHQGLSHHTLTSLGCVALTKCIVALPMIDQMRLLAVQEQINHSAISYKHKLKIVDGLPGIIELQEKGIKMSSMGRSYEEDQEYFLSAAAAGVAACELLRSKG